MSQVSMFGKFTCQEGKGEEMDAVLAEQTALVGSWDDTLAYSYHKAEGNQYYFYALFTGMEALQQQGESQELMALMPTFMGLLEAPPEMTMTAPVAGA